MNNPRKKTRWPLFLMAGFLVLFIGAAGLFWGVYSLFNSPERVAHERLDALLGDEADEPLAPQEIPEEIRVPDMMNRMLAEQRFALEGIRRQLSAVAGGVSVEETTLAYVLEVPIETERDAENVSVEVAPYHVQVAGQITSKSEDGHSVFSKTFRQGFATKDELQPDKVSRRIEGSENGDQTLVITIPKKHASAVVEENKNQKGQPVELSPEVIRQLQETNPEFI